MTQHEVLNFLMKHDNELFTSEELARKLKLTKGRITQNLRQLRRFFPVYAFTRGTQKFFLYGYSSKFNENKKDGHHHENNTTMWRTEVIFGG
jgi:predicted transcriptional regulator